MENTVISIMDQPLTVRKRRGSNILQLSPETERLMRNIALLFFIGNTFAILICIDLLVFRQLTLSLFTFIFIVVLAANVKIFRARGYKLGIGGI